MEKQTNIISIEEILRLVESPTDFGYAFALFRLPNQSEKHLMIDLDEPKRVSNEISNLSTGFVVNEFAENHPVRPLFIKSDILVSDFKELSISPSVETSKIDEFRKNIQSRPVIKKTEKVILKASENYQKIVENAIENIKNEAFDKVVISRFKQRELPTDFSAIRLFDKICNKYPTAFCSLVFTPTHGLWIGATPELLVSENVNQFQTISLAGTKPILENQTINEIAWTQKEIEEQAMVSRYIVDCFKKIRLRAYKEIGPHTYQAGKLAHLKSTFTVQKENKPFDGLIDQMLYLLHPTSAVCGMPIQPALAFLKNEGYERSFYAGFLGPVNMRNSTQLFVNLRCMSIQDNVATLYAGAGITEGSNPEKEFIETELKMNTMLDLLENHD